MATKFKTMTPTQRREARVQARMNKSKPPAPIFSDTSRGRRAAAEKAAMEVKPSGFQPNQSDRVIAEATAVKTDFEDIFLAIIQFLPPDEQSRAFSLFSVFRKQSPAEQKAIVDSLMDVAREQTGPMFDLYRQRIKEDTEYQKADLNRQLNNAQALYDRLVGVTDFNALRDKAKTDKSMAKTIRSITNTAFVDRALGGVQRRRSREAIDDAADVKKDIETKRQQDQLIAKQNLGQKEQEIKMRLDREDVLNKRDIFDKDQSQLEADRSLFLSLFENKFANAGDNARDNIESGDIDVRGAEDKKAGMRDDAATRADVFAQGGTDEQRRTRGKEEQRVKDAAAEQKRMDAGVTTLRGVVDRVKELKRYQYLLKMSGKDDPSLNAEINRLMPTVEREYQASASGKTSRIFDSKQAQSVSLDEILRNDISSWLDSSGIQKSYSGMDAVRRDEAIAKFGGQFSSFGQDFLEVPDVSYVNKYGNTQFDSSAAFTPDVLSDVGSVYNYQWKPSTTATPVGSVYNYQWKPSTTATPTPTYQPPTQSRTPVQPDYSGMSNDQAAYYLGNLRYGSQAATTHPTTTVTNPNTGQVFTGGAADRLAKRLPPK